MKKILSLDKFYTHAVTDVTDKYQVWYPLLRIILKIKTKFTRMTRITRFTRPESPDSPDLPESPVTPESPD